MTTFAFTVTLDETEMSTLEAALDAYEKLCDEEQPDDDPKRAHWAYRKTIEDIRRKLHSNPVQTSGNNFGWGLSNPAGTHDPKAVGLELADAVVLLMQTKGISHEEAAIFSAKEIVRRADRMTAAGETGEAVATWTELVTVAYGRRLDERTTQLQAPE